jgi:hypothetical protein
LRREIRNLDAWPRFELPSAGERLTFVRDGVKLNRYFGTVVTPDAPYPVFSVSSDNNPYASLVYRQKYQEDKVDYEIVEDFHFLNLIDFFFFFFFLWDYPLTGEQSDR